jgi:hypothetical protein
MAENAGENSQRTPIETSLSNHYQTEALKKLATA